MMVANALRPEDEVHFANVEEIVPDVNDAYYRTGNWARWERLPDPRFFSVHARFESAFPKTVYMVRDPRAVMVSYYHFMRHVDQELELSLGEFIRSRWHFPCEWHQHVQEWVLDRRHPTVLTLRYEDMHADPADSLEQVLSFAGMRTSAARIDKAVAATSFDEMKRLEERWHDEQQHLDADAEVPATRFIRQGSVGGWKDELDAKTLEFISERYGPVMHAVGYG